MYQRKKRITNILNSSVVIEDINVFLPGKGSYVDVSIELANFSKDLVKNSHFVKVTEIGSNNMPIWPLISRKPIPIHKNELETRSEPQIIDQNINISKEDINDIKELARSIKESLSHLAQKENNYPPELFERIISAISSSSGSHTPSSFSPKGNDPIFIPSTIVPDKDQAKSNFAAITDIESNKDIDSNINVLNSLRKNKKKK